jgi:predicted HTH domain antitoxin
MTISFEIPREIERELSESVADLNADAREAYLVNLYREDRITHHQLAEALGLSRLETEGVLKRHKVSSGVTAEEMRAQAAALREGLGKAMPK